MHMGGANGSTIFTDSSSNAFSFSRSGTPVISTSQSKFGGSSGSFPGSGYIFTSDNSKLSMGTSDFTMEHFVYFNTTPNDAATFGVGYSLNGVVTRFYPTSFNLEAFGYNTITANYTFNASQWYHIAYTRNSTGVRFFVDGILVKTQLTSPYNYEGFTTTLGARQGTRLLNGYLDEVRITKGVCRYTSDFPVPTKPFPDS
jgi:hypothetical protein